MKANKGGTMAKEPDKAQEYSAGEIESYIRQLSRGIEILTAALTIAKQNKSQTIVAHNRKAWERVEKSLDTGCMAMTKAIWSYERGKPISAGDFKPRSPAHDKPEGTKRGRKAKTNG